jgi:serine protease Do
MMHRSISFIAALVFATFAALPTVATGQASAPDASPGCPISPSSMTSRARPVVAIDVTQKVRRSRGPELSEDDPFYEFFRRFGQVPRPRGAPDREFDQQSVGSGFLISSDGYLITNAHVVDGADEVTVKLTDKREFKAKVVGSDKRTDVALLKIEATNLPKVTIGDPEKLRVGEWVVAIGKPFGLENTITAGIVSAKGRDLPQENLVPFIQTDAAVNPGNSGGPLFNLRGEVIGINSMIFSRTGGYMGLSFAIPIDLAMNSVAQLKEKGRVTRGRIGVQITEVNRETAESFGCRKRPALWSIRWRRADPPRRPASRRATSSSRRTARKCARPPSCPGSSP